MNLPECTNLELRLDAGVLYVTFNRPESRNAMSSGTVDELLATFEAIADDRSVRAVVLRGKDGNFCAGGDIKEMARIRASIGTVEGDPVAAYNRKFGTMLERVNAAPQATVAILEGAVLGGGFGLACVTDVAIARRDASFGLPETGIGVFPAQIAPFVVQRIGLSHARRLGVCGARFDGAEALRLGLVHLVAEAEEDLDELLRTTLSQIRRCAPHANAVTKELMLASLHTELGTLLDDAARRFSEASRGPEAAEGAMAFLEKRKPNWA
ncbi:enoyl-CoA hydratase-related protein [Pendulispora brunnea]|uniref:Enoyl-CoA hydratase-related protein n=1 Tax=Pendulispora brunnea TaxID=2905690 RepID=A0ABZ2JV77_9BACT